jgi:pseudouridine-5'-phosphate glycosidase
VSRLRLSEEVSQALADKRPIVALESSVLAQGLPEEVGPDAWQRWEQAIRAEGAIPATTAVLEGHLAVGLSRGEVERLADRGRAGLKVAKAARRDLGALLQTRQDAGTTVSATLAIAHAAGIRIAATGGIGGVHRGYADTPDESADLRTLAELPVVLFCAGAKAILDVPATLERLETYSVPVWGYGTSVFPVFYTMPAGAPEALRLERRFDEPAALAAAIEIQLEVGSGGALVAVPPPEVEGLTAQAIEAAVADALVAAARAGVRGKQLTPFLLAEVAGRTGGLALHANLALLEKNAQVSARVAVAWSAS